MTTLPDYSALIAQAMRGARARILPILGLRSWRGGADRIGPDLPWL